MKIFSYRFRIKLVGVLDNQWQVSELPGPISSPITSTHKYGHHFTLQRQPITTAVQKWNRSHDPINTSRYSRGCNLIGSKKFPNLVPGNTFSRACQHNMRWVGCLGVTGRVLCLFFVVCGVFTQDFVVRCYYMHDTLMLRFFPVCFLLFVSVFSCMFKVFVFVMFWHFVVAVIVPLVFAIFSCLFLFLFFTWT